jgi:hypothetical protein
MILKHFNIKSVSVYSAKIEENKKFYKKLVIFYGFWRFFEVHSILDDY